MKDAAKGQNDYKMSGLLSNATFRLVARPVVQHTCIITPKIINIRNRMYYSKKNTLASMRLFLLTFLISISNSGVETWHLIHLSHTKSKLLNAFKM
jgi:hypothetical protein